MSAALSLGRSPLEGKLPFCREARSRFLASGFPTRALEAWRYTALAPSLRAVLSAGESAVHVPLLRVVAGRAEVIPLAELKAFPEIDYEAVLPMALLNRALVSGGYEVRVAAGLRAVCELSVDDESGSHPYLRYVVEPGAELTLIERHTGARPRNGLFVFQLHEKASVEHCVVAESAELISIATYEIELAEKARYRMHRLGMAQRFWRSDVLLRLAAPGAEAEIGAMALLSARSHIDHHSLVRHDAPQTRSEERVRMLGFGRGRAIFYGQVRVAPQAHASSAQQSCKSLLLSPEAEIIARPELEIYCDEVRCSHGATVGQLDAEALFYLISRGLAPEEAEGILLRVFFEDVLQAIPQEVKAQIEAQLAELLLAALRRGDERSDLAR